MTKLEPTKKLVSADGTIAYYWNGKMHNWDSWAFAPKGDTKKAEYYLFGIKYSKLDWLTAKRDVTGLPPAKQAAFKSSLRED